MPIYLISKKVLHIAVTFCLFFIISCKSTGSTFARFLENKKNFDKFTDSYSNNTYTNHILDFFIEFDNNWELYTQYIDFNEQQQKYARYFTTETSEVLFIGLNEKYDIGVRCLTESLSMPIEEYAKAVRKQNTDNKEKYKINFKKDEKVEFDNFEVFNFVYEIEVNPLNIFVFDSILFKNFAYNYRLEFWTKNDKYNENKSIIENIYKTVKFEKTENIEDESNDTAEHI